MQYQCKYQCNYSHSIISDNQQWLSKQIILIDFVSLIACELLRIESSDEENYFNSFRLMSSFSFTFHRIDSSFAMSSVVQIEQRLFRFSRAVGIYTRERHLRRVSRVTLFPTKKFARTQQAGSPNAWKSRARSHDLRPRPHIRACKLAA